MGAWDDKDFMTFNQDKCEVLHLGRNNPVLGLGAGWLSWDWPCEKARLDRGQWIVLAAVKMNCMLSSVSRSVSCRSAEGIILLCWAYGTASGNLFSAS